MTETNDAQSMDLHKRIRIEVLETLASQGPPTFVISIVIALLVYIVLRREVETSLLWIWMGGVITFNVLRLMMILTFWRMDNEKNSYRVWTATYLMLVYGTGVCWGILPLFDVFYRVDWAQGFIIFVISGMSAGGLLSLYAKLTAAVPYFTVSLLPLIYALASGTEQQHYVMAILASLFLILLVRSSYYLNTLVTKTIRLEVENDELFKFLKKVRTVEVER